MSANFQLRQAADGQWTFNLTAENNKIILTSETYTTRQAALNGIESVRANGAVAERFERRQSRDGRDYFVLKAANHEIIGTSEMYSSAAAMENGIQAVMRVAAAAQVEDRP
jgi:uncharacterized protein YegP (UPF0339 family)